jgi:hypothetical protein
MQTKINFKNAMMAALSAGVLAAVLNNLYSLVYSTLSGFAIPDVINAGSVSAASLFPMLLGGVLFFFMQRRWSKGGYYFILLAAVFTLLSMGGPFAGTLPDGGPLPAGFAGLTAPMHLIAGGAAMLIPRFARRFAVPKTVAKA